MSETRDALNISSATEDVLAKLGDDDAADDAGAGTDMELDGTELLDAAQELPAFDNADDDTAQEDEADSLIDPPASWKADAKKRFHDLPRDLQRVIADRERERESHFSRTQQETAEVRKANQAERAAVQNERLAYAQGLSQLIEQMKTVDPVVAEGQRTDWASLSQQNPAVAQAKWAQYQQRLQQLQATAAQRRDLQARIDHENHRRADEELGTALDFWKDQGQRTAFKSHLSTFLAGNGFAPEEIQSVADSRVVLVARKAMLYDQLMAEQAKIAAARRSPAPQRVLKSQAALDYSEASARAHKLKARAARSGRIDDAAAAILASL